MRTLLLAVLLVTPALLGCLGEDDEAPPGTVDEGYPVPVPLCHEGIGCNFEMTPDEGREGNEVSIAVNPKDPRNVVGAAKDYFPPDAGECVWDGIYVTHDGGVTYEDRSFDGSPWRQLEDPDPSRVNYATQFWCTTDPVVYFNTEGTFYYLLMAYQADPVTGSKLGEDTIPPHPLGEGALNDWAFNRAVQIVAVSDDGGNTFHTFSPILEGSYPVAFHDKGWLAASRDGTIHVGWLAFVEGNLYFRSTDGGETWQDPVLMAPFVSPDEETLVGAGQGTFVDVGPGDEVYYSWSWGSADEAGIALVRSGDRGATWDETRIVQEMVPTTIDNALSARDRRNHVWPVLATDRSLEGPFSGAVYFAWQDGRNDRGDILFTASFDGGETFSDPVRLNDDETGSIQLFPAISVSPGGVIDVTWMDQRRDVEGYHIDQYYTYSLDGGKTWAPNFRVRDVDGVGWDPALCHHQNGMVFIGDYIDIDSSWQAAHPVWPDSRHGVCDVFTATLQRPLFADGFPEEKKAEIEAWVAEHPLT